ncbi:zinc finger protein 37-like isoform X2 [Periplaneta americana]|uniref:zinc finger protein 37-like isoform X2 n=1 Tax=Periplaneta americana TaxID=6978 RepID=UPI0037E72150
MALSDSLVSKTFMNLEIFLQKAAALDIFEALIFNYKLKIGLLDPLAFHFLGIVADLANQLQLLYQETREQKEYLETFQVAIANPELCIRKPDTHFIHATDPLLLSVKTEEHPITVENDPIVLPLYDDVPEAPAAAKSCAKSPTAAVCKQKQKISRASPSKKGEDQAKSHGKNEDQDLENGRQSFRCSLCHSNFSSEDELLAHFSKCRKHAPTQTKAKPKTSRIYKCSHCDSEFTARKFLTTHVNRTHKSGNAAMPEDASNGSCGMLEDSITILTEETQLQTENLPFYCCKVCQVAFKVHNDFEAHLCRNGSCTLEGTILHNYVQSHEKQLITNLEKLKTLKKYQCGVCHEEYRSVARMSYHLPRCIKGPYHCELCGDQYMFKKDLNLHKKKEHRGAHSFFCDECGLTFKFRTSLQKHKVNRHETEQGPFSCEECGKNFAKRVQLTNHKINTHRIERKFLCQVCGNKFSNYGSLMAHLDTHTERRRFSCSFCNKKFRQKEKLKYHTRIHTGERPHLCPTCGKGFIRKSKLDEHMRRHRGEKRYHCNICNKSYAAGWDLKLHNKKQHPNVPDTTSRATPPPVDKENPQSSQATSSQSPEKDEDEDDPDDPEPVCESGEGNETEDTPEQTEKVDTPEEDVNMETVQTDSEAVPQENEASEESGVLVHLDSNPQPEQQDSQIIVPDGNVGSANSGILVQLNPLQAENAATVSPDTANQRILVQLDPSQIQNHPLVLNGGAGTNNSKLILQLDSTQLPPALAQSSSGDSNRVLLQLDPSQAQNAAILHNGAAAPSGSRILLQLDPGHNQSLPPNTVLAVADTIHLAPLVDDGLTAQYIQLAPTQTEEAVPDASSGVPLHIQLPVSAVQLPVSQQGSGSAAFELQSLPVQGQTGLVFTPAGFDVSSLTY